MIEYYEFENFVGKSFYLSTHFHIFVANFRANKASIFAKKIFCLQLNETSVRTRYYYITLDHKEETSTTTMYKTQIKRHTNVKKRLNIKK